MKYEIYKDEWYPLYIVSEEPGGDIELTVEEYIRIQDAFSEFNSVQEMLKEKHMENCK